MNKSKYVSVEAYIESQMRRLHIPGAALAIIEGDQIVCQRGFGQARPGGEAPTAQTPFFIGSLTKSITALATLQLTEAGKIELDTRVQRYLPWFRVRPPKNLEDNPQVSSRITVRHLLNQTSGLPMSAGMAALADFDDRPNALERQSRALSTLALAHLPGEVCEYSNLNYNLLGLIIETVSGEAYPDYVQNHIFEPLHMKHSYTTRAEAQHNDLAMGYRHWFSLPIPAPGLPIPHGSLPSGQLISCAEDMAHYLIAHLNGGRYGDAQILSEAGIHELHRGVVEYKMMGISGGYYGMGWFDTDLGETKIFSHGGNVPDFSSYMAILPGLKKGLVILFNADPYALPPIIGEVGANVTTLLAGQQPAPIRLDFIQWIMRLLPVIPLLQFIGVAATLRRLRRWRKQPTQGNLWGRHILLPLVPNLTLAAVPFFLMARGLFRYLRIFMPDLYWIALVSGGLAGIWSVVRTILMLQAHGSK